MNRKSGSVEERLVLGQEACGSNLGSVAPKHEVVVSIPGRDSERVVITVKNERIYVLF